MSPTRVYIERLAKLKEGELSILRQLAGRPISDRLHGFDLFTGMWWPLRSQSPRTPRREPSWLVAKLWATYGRRLPLAAAHTAAVPRIPTLLGAIASLDEGKLQTYRPRVQALLACNTKGLEPHLRWALDRITETYANQPLDWVGLLDDLSDWDAAGTEFATSDARVRWAREYLTASRHPTTRQGFANAD